MANDKNGRFLGMANKVTVSATVTNIIGDTVTLKLDDGTVITIPSVDTVWVSGKPVQPA